MRPPQSGPQGLDPNVEFVHVVAVFVQPAVDVGRRFAGLLPPPAQALEHLDLHAEVGALLARRVQILLGRGAHAGGGHVTLAG